MDYVVVSLHCLNSSLPMLVRDCKGALDGHGAPVKIMNLTNKTEWENSSEEKDMANSLVRIREVLERNQVALLDGGKAGPAYHLVFGDKTLDIKSIKSEDELKKICYEFFGIQGDFGF